MKLNLFSLGICHVLLPESCPKAGNKMLRQQQAKNCARYSYYTAFFYASIRYTSILNRYCLPQISPERTLYPLFAYQNITK